MNQCIDTVTPEHLEDRGRNTEKLKKGRSVWANANTHTYACARPPPLPTQKKQQFLTVTYNFHCVLAIKSSLLHTHTQQARLLVHPLK